MKGSARIILTASVFLFTSGEAVAQGVVSIAADPDYNPQLDDPTYAQGAGPIVGVYGIDTAYTIANRFRGFARLLSADGYTVQSFQTAFTPGCSANLEGCAYFRALLAIDTLVMANRRDPISDEEADVLEGWLSGALGCARGCTPRRLFLSAGSIRGDGDPVVDYPGAIAKLSERLGLVWPNASLNGRLYEYAPASSESSGLLIPHLLLAGGGEDLIRNVRVPAEGTAFASASAAGSILTLPRAPDAPAGYSQAMTLIVGTGRVYVSGDADAHTALLHQDTRHVTPINTRLGLGASPPTDNQKYLLHVMHWLDGIPPDRDGDSIADSVDNCLAEANGSSLTNQLDIDLDGFGNRCDSDFDNDGIVGARDFNTLLACYQDPGTPPADDPNCAESDLDGDGFVTRGDFTRFARSYARPLGPSGLSCADPVAPAAPCFARTFADADGDGFLNGDDGCVALPTPVNLDADGDGFGNACDGDLRNDGSVDAADYGVFVACFLHRLPTPLHDLLCSESDLDGSGTVDEADLELWKVGFATTGVPGPSGKACADATSRLAPCQTPAHMPNEQRPDPNYNPDLGGAAEYEPGGGPLVAVDSAHHNYNVIGDLYQGFYKLLTADGYDVYDFPVPFTAGCSKHLATCAYLEALKQFDTLVISNARTPISAEEAEVISGWLSGALGCASSPCPRRLILIADHQQLDFNFPLKIAELTQRLGLDWPNSNVNRRTFTPTLPSRYNPHITGLLATGHPIVTGRVGLDEDVVSVSTFFGSGLFAGAPGVSLLSLPAGSVWTDATGTALNAAGLSQGMAFEFGNGRVYASAEAAMFSAQDNGRNTPPFGMSALPFDHNQQFLLNIMHWLDKRL